MVRGRFCGLFFSTVGGFVKMSQQHNKIIKRRRRKAYLERCKMRIRAQMSKKK